MFLTLWSAYRAAETRKSLARIKRAVTMDLAGGSLFGIGVADDEYALVWQEAHRQSIKFRDAFELRIHELLSELGALQLRNAAMLGALAAFNSALQQVFLVLQEERGNGRYKYRGSQ
jgi:hypothetical protein